jgi:hypothetical protein
VFLDDALYRGQTDADAFKLFLKMQTLEYATSAITSKRP